MTEEPDASNVGSRFGVSRSAFERQLRWIRELGLTGCAVEDSRLGRSGAVAITFDDGTIDHFTHAFDALVHAGMTATFFVTTGWVGMPGYVSWEQLREMAASGMSIQSHSVSHPFLSELSRPELDAEFRGSKDALDRRLGQHTTSLALPGGDPPARRYRGLVADAGYDLVATSRWGVNPARHSHPGTLRYIRRCTVAGRLSRADFEAVVTGDGSLAVRRRIREGVLRGVRRSLGPTRYARWRRAVLRAVGGWIPT